MKKQEEYHIYNGYSSSYVFITKNIRSSKKINADHSKENNHQKNNANEVKQFGILIFNCDSDNIIEKKEYNMNIKKENNEFILLTLVNDNNNNIGDQHENVFINIKKVRKRFQIQTNLLS